MRIEKRQREGEVYSIGAEYLSSLEMTMLKHYEKCFHNKSIDASGSVKKVCKEIEKLIIGFYGPDFHPEFNE